MDSYPTPDTTQTTIDEYDSVRRRSARNSLSGKKHLNYDQHYHPMDKSIRPVQARKRRRAHYITSSEDDEILEDTEGEEASSDEQPCEEEASSPFRPSKRVMKERHIASPSKGWRRSDRVSRATTPPFYDMSIHPQDRRLSEAGISVAKVRKNGPSRRKKPKGTSGKVRSKEVEIESDGTSDIEETEVLEETEKSVEAEIADEDGAIEEAEDNENATESSPAPGTESEIESQCNFDLNESLEAADGPERKGTSHQDTRHLQPVVLVSTTTAAAFKPLNAKSQSDERNSSQPSNPQTPPKSGTKTNIKAEPSSLGTVDPRALILISSSSSIDD